MSRFSPAAPAPSLLFIKSAGFCFASALVLGWAGQGSAQSVAPAAVASTEVEAVVVTGRRTAAVVARERAALTPGGASVIGASSYDTEGAVLLADALAGAPGVVVQTFFGGNDQPRLQLRGSGLQQNPAERGVLFLQDGLPLNRADGSYVVSLVDPRQAAFIEVFRGSAANRLGATVLGGALNFVSPSGADAPGLRLQLEGGSFGHVYAALDGGGRQGDWAAHGAVSQTERDGFRAWNDSSRTSVVLSGDYGAGSAVTSRILAGYVHSAFDVSGPLTRDMLEADPTQVSSGPTMVAGVARNPGPNVVRDRPNRETTLVWIGNRTTATQGAHALDLALGYVEADDRFIFPMSSGVRETDGGDVNVMARYALLRPGRGLPRLELTSHLARGSADRTYALNISGERGAVFGEGDLEATTFGFNATASLDLTDRLTLAPSLAWARAERDWSDRFAPARRPTAAFSPMNPRMRLPDGSVPTTDTSYARDYDGFSPALALTWRAGPQLMAYGALSRTFEPPSHDDLLATVNGTPNSSAGRPNPGNPALAAEVFRTPDLKAQTSTTLELGVRGERGRVRFDGLVYRAEVRDELLNLRDATGVSLGAINAGKTRHVGAEIGLTAELGDRLQGALAYTYQDFRFVDDPLRGDNQLAGAPPHVVNASLAYAVSSETTVTARVHWRPSRTPVDNMNTLYSDAFATVDLSLAHRLRTGATAVFEVRNLLDETYASSTLVVDQARPDQAVYLPGEGRALSLSLRLDF